MKLEMENVYFQNQSSTLPAFTLKGNDICFCFVGFLARSWRMFAEKSASSIKTKGDCGSLLATKAMVTRRFNAALYASLQATSDNHLPFSWRIHIFL